MSNQQMSSAGSASGSSGPPNLFLERGETVLLAPDSQRFSAFYQRVYPRGIDEVRSLLGLTESASQAIEASGCRKYCTPTALYSPDSLTSDDPATRRRSKATAVEAAYHYVMGVDTGSLAQWKPLLDRYIEIGKVVINIILLQDIEISDGATLVISASTNALYANNIKIHDTGRMWCQGDVSIRCTTLQGVIRRQPGAIPASAALASQLRTL